MTATTGPATTGRRLSQLDALESESIHIIREVVAEFEKPVLLFSGGKDSVVMLHLAAKAFWPAPVPFAVLHVDTGHNFSEVLAYRDATVERLGLRLEVASVQAYIDDGRLRDRADGTRNPLQTQPLLDAIAGHRFDAVFGWPARRGEGARQGMDPQPARRVRAVGPAQPAPRAVEPLQRAAPPGRALPRLPAQQLDRARRLALRRTRGHRAPCPVVRPRARGVRARRHVAGGGSALPATAGRAGRDAHGGTARSATCRARVPSSARQ